jgi:hypothetical protein
MNDHNQHAAIFENIGQALHVAFLIMSVEAQQDSPMRKALLRMMEYVNGLSDEQCDWYDQLRGTRTGNINFAGLTAMEVRAQCAMITAAVESKLADPEKWVLQAKYGQMASAMSDHERERYRMAERYVALVKQSYEPSEEMIAAAERELSQLGNKPRIAFSMQRITAIQGLSSWLSPTFPKVPPLAMDCMLAKLFCNNVHSTISFRDLSTSFGSSHMTYARVYPRLKEHVRYIELKAMMRLEPYFIGQGIVSPHQIKTA